MVSWLKCLSVPKHRNFNWYFNLNFKLYVCKLLFFGSFTANMWTQMHDWLNPSRTDVTFSGKLVQLTTRSILFSFFCPYWSDCCKESNPNLSNQCNEWYIEYFDIVFAFNLSIKIYSSMKIHHVKKAYFAQQIVRWWILYINYKKYIIQIVWWCILYVYCI